MTKAHKMHYSYGNSGIVVLRDAASQVASSAIFVVHESSSHPKLSSVVEIVYLATKRKCENKGYGTKLLRTIIDIAASLETAGVVAMANRAATKWWLTRPFSMFRHVVSSETEVIGPVAVNAALQPHESTFGVLYTKSAWPRSRFRYAATQASHVWFPSALHHSIQQDNIIVRKRPPGGRAGLEKSRTTGQLMPTVHRSRRRHSGTRKRNKGMRK